MRYLLLYPELTYEIFDDAGVLLLASLRVRSSPLWITFADYVADYANGQLLTPWLQGACRCHP